MTEFYMASTEGYTLENPRRCTPVRRLRGPIRDDYLLIKIDPPLIGQPFGLGANDIDEVIVATRLEGVSLFPIERWPVDVYVVRLLVASEAKETVMADEMELIAWAELYPTEEHAKARTGD